jgi:hypothetical protein
MIEIRRQIEKPIQIIRQASCLEFHNYEKHRLAAMIKNAYKTQNVAVIKPNSKILGQNITK